MEQVRLRADWVRVLEMAYASAKDDDAWASGVAEASVGMFARCQGIGLIAIEHSADCASGKAIVSVGPAEILSAFGPASAIFEHMGPAGFRAVFYPRSIVVTHGALRPSLGQMGRDYMGGLHHRMGTENVLGVVAHPVPGVAMVLWGLFDRPVTLSPHERKRLAQLAIHLETGYRLRRRPETLRAVLRPDGHLEHWVDGAPEPSLLAAQAVRMETARNSRTRRNAEAIDFWEALVSGAVSMVERTIGSQRHYLVLDNAPRTQPIRVLTRGELDVLSLTTRGLSAKLVAYALGISAASVSTRLSSAASKVGMATRIELVRLAAMFTRDPRARFEKTALTTAERDVLELVSQGLSNREIAAMRSRSVRTIANQIASLLRKTESVSRRGLVALVSGK